MYSRLTQIRFSSNEIREVPTTLLALPRLCWVALAGNPWGRAALRQSKPLLQLPRLVVSARRLGPNAFPCSSAQKALVPSQRTPTPQIGKDLVLLRKIGEGTSGVVWRGAWRKARGSSMDPRIKS